MGFEYEELEPPEVASLALEYVRNAAGWLEEAAANEDLADEVRRVLAAAGRSTRQFHEVLESRVRDRYGDELPAAGRLSHRLRRRPDLVSWEELESDSAVGLLEVASAEEEAAYQYFLDAVEEVDDTWLQELFREMAHHTRGVVQYLEAEREVLADSEGRG